jgi:hypothetical protein
MSSNGTATSPAPSPENIADDDEENGKPKTKRVSDPVLVAAQTCLTAVKGLTQPEVDAVLRFLDVRTGRYEPTRT